MDITYVGSKPVSELKAPLSLTQARPVVLVDIHPDPTLEEPWTTRSLPSVGVQTRPQLCEHDAATEAAPLVDAEVRALGTDDDENVARYRKKVERSDQFAEAIGRLSATIDPLLALNAVTDLDAAYFGAPDRTAEAAAPAAVVLNFLRDPAAGAARWAAALSWGEGGQLAVAYSSMDFVQGLRDAEGVADDADPSAGATGSRSSYIWDVAAGTVVHELKVPGSPLTAILHTDKDPHLLAAATYSGLVCLYDTRGGSASRPVAVTPRGVAHRDSVSSLVSLKAKSGTEVLAGSVDGSVKVWDLRAINTPLDELWIHSGAAAATAGGAEIDPEMRYGVTALSFDPQAGITRFLAGTEQGAVVSTNRKGQSPYDRILGVQAAHAGPVAAIARSPFYPRCALSAGGWTTRLWHDDARGAALLTSSFSRARFAAVAWSPVRPGVFASVDTAGTVHIWDISQQLTAPVLAVSIVDAPLCSAAFSPDGTLLACGAADGSVSIVSLSAYFSTPVPEEKSRVGAIIERELHRAKNLAALSANAGTTAAAGVTAAEVLPPLSGDELAAVEAEVAALWGEDMGEGAADEDVVEA